MLKRIFTFMICFLPWLLSGLLFSYNLGFYKILNKPFFALPSFLFGPVWTILYILIALSITILISSNYIKYETEYKKSLLSNYVFNQLFLFCFFSLKSVFLGFIDSILIFITSLFLYYETKELNKKAAWALLPYIFFNFYAVILSLTIYFMNL